MNLPSWFGSLDSSAKLLVVANLLLIPYLVFYRLSFFALFSSYSAEVAFIIFFAFLGLFLEGMRRKSLALILILLFFSGFALFIFIFTFLWGFLSYAGGEQGVLLATLTLFISHAYSFHKNVLSVPTAPVVIDDSPAGIATAISSLVRTAVVTTERVIPPVVGQLLAGFAGVFFVTNSPFLFLAVIVLVVLKTGVDLWAHQAKYGLAKHIIPIEFIRRGSE